MSLKDKEVTTDELSLMVQNFNKMYSNNRFKVNDHNYSRLRNEGTTSRLRDRHCHHCVRSGHFVIYCSQPLRIKISAQAVCVNNVKYVLIRELIFTPKKAGRSTGDA